MVQHRERYSAWERIGAMVRFPIIVAFILLAQTPTAILLTYCIINERVRAFWYWCTKLDTK